MITALYPGTFDPFTKGHLNILQRGLRLCDQMIVAVAPNEGKSPMFSADERRGFIEHDIQRHKLDSVRVEIFGGLLVQFAIEHQAHIILRGLRAISDFEYEFQMASMNLHFAQEIETVFLAATGKNHFISSGMVKEVAAVGGNVGDFVSPQVAKALFERCRRS